MLGGRVSEKCVHEFAKFWVELRLDPWHVLALCADARFHARDAVCKRQVKEIYRVAFR